MKNICERLRLVFNKDYFCQSILPLYVSITPSLLSPNKVHNSVYQWRTQYLQSDLLIFSQTPDSIQQSTTAIIRYSGNLQPTQLLRPPAPFLVFLALKGNLLKTQKQQKITTFDEGITKKIW